jgi:hypothetical protein
MLKVARPARELLTSQVLVLSFLIVYQALRGLWVEEI